MPLKTSSICFLCGLLLVVAVPGALCAADLQIEHVTIVSPERSRPMQDAMVRVHGGRIVSISTARHPAEHLSTDTVSIDGTHLFLSPGLIDSHVHLGEIPGMTAEQEASHPDIAQAARQQIPRSYLLYGFTTLIDLNSTPAAMAQWKSQPTVPDTYFCGGAAIMDGYPMNFTPKPLRYQSPYLLIEPGMTPPAGIDSAMHTPQAVVARMKADGALCVKTYYEQGFGNVRGLPLPKLETIRELVSAAHTAGMPVLMHANSDVAQTFGLQAGVDILAHGLWNWNEEASSTTQITPAIRKILDGVVAGNVGWQPTIQVLCAEQDLFNPSFLSDPRLAQVVPSSLIDWYRSSEGQWFHDVLLPEFHLPANADAGAIERLVDERVGPAIERVKHATAYLAEHQGRILFGTDTPSGPTYANPPGLNGWLEMHRLLEAGESAQQIFQSATLSNARALKLDKDRGTVEIGKRADLLLLRQDPTKTIDAYGDIAKVILNGRVLDPAELAANR
jgi:imidazolonepropionase-like amidohydrolase